MQRIKNLHKNDLWLRNMQLYTTIYDLIYIPTFLVQKINEIKLNEKLSEGRFLSFIFLGPAAH